MSVMDLKPNEEAYCNELNGFLDLTPVDEFGKIPGIEYGKDGTLQDCSLKLDISKVHV